MKNMIFILAVICILVQVTNGAATVPVFIETFDGDAWSEYPDGVNTDPVLTDTDPFGGPEYDLGAGANTCHGETVVGTSYQWVQGSNATLIGDQPEELVLRNTVWSGVFNDPNVQPNGTNYYGNVRKTGLMLNLNSLDLGGATKLEVSFDYAWADDARNTGVHYAVLDGPVNPTWSGGANLYASFGANDISDSYAELTSPDETTEVGTISFSVDISGATGDAYFVFMNDLWNNRGAAIDNITISKVVAAHTPVPANFADPVDPLPTEVSWSAPTDPNMTVTGYDVYWSAVEPNYLTATPVSVNQPGNSYTPAAVDFLTTYYWRVDTYVAWDSNSITGNWTDILEGDPWQFTTVGAAPSIQVYDNVVTALSLPDATLSATVLDGNLDVTSAVFELLTDDSEYPAGAVASLTPDVSDLYNPQVTLTTDTAGTYKIRLTVTDAGADSDEAIAQVIVYESACDAQKAGNTSAWVQDYYDRDGDCIVNLNDYAVFALEWLDDSSLQAQEPYTGAVTYVPTLINDAVLGQMLPGEQIDGWPNNMVIDLVGIYTNETGSPVTLQIDEFALVAKAGVSALEPVTPFVVSWIPDPNIVDPNTTPTQFTVEAIGTTRLAGTDYAAGYNAVAFDSVAAPQIIVEPGEIIAAGFVDNDGSGGGKVAGSVVRRTAGVGKVWRVSDPEIADTSSLAVGQSPIVNPNSTNVELQDRIYSYQIGCSIAP